MTILELLECYQTLPLRAKAHITLRWAIAPMIQLEQLVPTTGVILDLGCGHGVFSLYLAKTSRSRQVIGVDWDARKIKVAQSLQEPNLRFETGDVGSSESLPKANAVVLVDVAYLLDPPSQQRLIERCFESLLPGGVLIVKETTESPRWKARLLRAQERCAVMALRITKGDGLHMRTQAEWVAMIERHTTPVKVIPLDRHYCYPHTAFVARRAESMDLASPGESTNALPCNGRSWIYWFTLVRGAFGPRSPGVRR